jgi:DNA-binding beta-propeller fold protein YncE
MSTESIAIHPKTGYVWVSADRRSLRDTVNNRAWTANTFYAYNPATKTVVDSFNVAAWDPSGTGPLPRGIAFSPSGDTVYVGHFDVGTVPAVARFIKNFGAGVIRDPGAVPTGYTLEQNFPNPFNPSTEIKFSIAKSGMTSLRVFDVLGRQVADLVHSDLAPGTYRATFDASRLSSGTYIYELRSGDTRLVKKMMLMK